MITVEDVDLANPSAGHEEALSLPKLSDAEPLDVLHRRREPVQMQSKRIGHRLREIFPEVESPNKSC